ncbi:MAG: M20/M25/M40 family metallo-hydrolase [Lachnospiraceae bacterium]|nr:M20/M25/M40 family metallo-hydrolase [Lachnospiraceae bacterium]
MSDDKSKINRVRLICEFIKLTSFDSESFNEEKISEYLKGKLKELGLKVESDTASEILKEISPGTSHPASNIYATLKGKKAGQPVLFSAHMDTVKPGTGKRALLHQDGKITSKDDTVLGADDVSGLVSIIEALTVIKENGLSTPDLEIVFTAAEEPYCTGSRFLAYDRIKAREGYVLDMTGPVGKAALAAPSILSVSIKVNGRSAHAGFAPEQGINALSIAAGALAKIKTGRIDEDLTLNFGTIIGGSGKNIVPESVEIEGEIRSMDHRKATDAAAKIRTEFENAASEYGGSVEVTVTEQIHSYRVSKERNVVKRFIKAAGETERCIKPECIDTFGGSDANRLNEHGIETIVLACAMENCHSTNEYTTVEELEKSAELTLKLMTL